MRSARTLVLICAVALGATACYVTKVVSVPMRVVGAVASAVPVVGNTAHDTIDEAADTVDALPLP